MSARTFAIIGGTLWGNRGAEAMVVTTIGRIRERDPDARFVLMSYYPGADRKLAEGAGVVVDNASPASLLLRYMPFALVCWVAGLVRVRWPDALLPAAARRLRACAGLLDVSGISFHDGRLGVLVYNVFCIWPALLLGVPVVHLSQARGPFAHAANRVLARHFLGACRHSFARGSATAAHMEELGLPRDRWSIAADIAFSFRAGDSLTNEGAAEAGPVLAALAAAVAAGRRVVAISPSSVVLGKTRGAGIDYVGILARAMERLHAAGCYLVVLPNATRAGGTGLRNNDIPVIQSIRDRLPEPLRTDQSAIGWVTFDVNTDVIRRLVEPCDLVVTSRFHAMVAGLSVGTPVFVIGWSHKYGEVLEMFGCEQDAIDFAHLDADLERAIDAALERSGETRARVIASRSEVEASSIAQFDALEALVGSRPQAVGGARP